MLAMMKRFFNEEDGMGTVEIVIIVAVLVGLALIFRKQMYSFVNQIFAKIFGDAGVVVDTPSVEELKENTLGQSN